jgi:hypothetical protein
MRYVFARYRESDLYMEPAAAVEQERIDVEVDVDVSVKPVRPTIPGDGGP